MHIGLIGGIGPAATEFYYRGLVKAHKQAGKVMDMTIVHADSGTLYRNFTARNVPEQVENFLTFIKRLKAAGAEAVAVTSLAGHYCIRELEEVSPLPIINNIPVLNTYFAEQGLRKIGLLGTDAVMESRLYGGISSVEIIVPDGDDLAKVHQAYITMALAGFAKDQDRDFLFSAAEKLRDENDVEAIVLGGTDLFLAFDGYDGGYPLIDCAEVHIAAIARASMST